MGRETSIIYSMKDQTGAAFGTLANSNKQFKQAMEDNIRVAEAFQKRQDALTKQLAEAKTAQTVAAQAVAEATKALKAQNDEVSKVNLSKAQEEYQQLTADVKNLQQAVNSAGKDLVNLDAQQRRMENSGIGGGGSGGMMEQMAKAGFTKMAGDLAASLGSTVVSSALGSEVGGMFESVLSGAASGAAMGMLGGPITAGVGAGIGAAMGLVSGGLQMFESRDTAYKSGVQEMVTGAMAGQSASLASGSSIAAGREQNRIAFTHRFGSEEDADSFLEDVRLMAIKTNYAYDEIVGYAKSMLNFAETDEVLSLLGTLSDTTAGLGLDRSDVGMMIQGLQQMRIAPERDVVKRTTDYFEKRGLDVYEAVGNYLGVDKSTALGMLSDNKVSNEDAYHALVSYMNSEFGGLSDSLMGTYAGVADNLEDLKADLYNAQGEGYNTLRQEGLGAQTEYLEGEGGDRMQEAYRRMGEFQAFQENEAERYEREMLDAIMTGVLPDIDGLDPERAARLTEMAEEYARITAEDSQEANAAAGRLLAEAQIMAQMEYMAGPGAAIAQDSQLALIASVQAAGVVDNAWYMMGIDQSKAYSRGLMSGFGGVSGMGDSSQYISYDSFGGVPGFAYGLNRVPYDGFPAVLHEGERVLTANEARAAGSGSGSGVSIQIGEVTVYGADEAAAYQVAQIIANEVASAAANYAG